MTSFLFSDKGLWFLLLTVLSITVIVTIVIFYHWYKYGRNNISFVYAQIIYIGVLLALFANATFVLFTLN